MTTPSPTPGASPQPSNYTNSDGSFNPGGAATTATTTTNAVTDVYGL